MSNTTVPISEWCKEIRVALARKEMNLQSVADEIGYSYTTITALISGRIVKIHVTADARTQKNRDPYIPANGAKSQFMKVTSIWILQKVRFAKIV